MIVAEHWPIMPPELQPKHLELVQALGAIPSHAEVDFTGDQEDIIKHTMLDTTPKEASQELGIVQHRLESYLSNAYKKLEQPHGDGRWKLPHLMFVAIDSGIMPSYPDLSKWRPELEPEDAMVILSLATRHRLDSLAPTSWDATNAVARTREKLDVKTHHGIVSKSFMFGFLTPRFAPTGVETA